MEQPLVSIVVVSYNHSKYIRENLDSIKAQTYPNIELIVGDDASKDNSVEVFEQWLSENNYPAKKNFHTKNMGLATMLNECTEILSGKYVKFIAADDYLHPESIAKCVEKLEELGDEYGMVFTDTFAVDGNSKRIQDFADYNQLGNIPKEEFREKLLLGNRIAALTVLMRTDILLETGAYDSKFLVEDYYRWLKINDKYFIGYVAEKLAYYRIHGENTSISKSLKLEEEVIQLQMLFDKSGICRDIIGAVLLKRYSQKQEISSETIDLYQNYGWHTKRLVFALKNRIPFNLYKLSNRFL